MFVCNKWVPNQLMLCRVVVMGNNIYILNKKKITKVIGTVVGIF